MSEPVVSQMSGSHKGFNYEVKWSREYQFYIATVIGVEGLCVSADGSTAKEAEANLIDAITATIEVMAEVRNGRRRKFPRE